MLPTPSANQFRGLSAPDLTICLSYYALAEGHQNYYRDRLWLEWHDREKLNWEGVALKWKSLPIATQDWITVDYRDAEISRQMVAVAACRLRRRLNRERPKYPPRGKDRADAGTLAHVFGETFSGGTGSMPSGLTPMVRRAKS
jgi:hypothetical protein